MEEDETLSVQKIVKHESTADGTDLLKVSLKLEADLKVEEGSGSMADRVKRRRRGQP